MVSKLGTWMQNTAQVLLAYKLTHSCLAVGLVHLSVTIRLRFAPRGAYVLSARQAIGPDQRACRRPGKARHHRCELVIIGLKAR